jgi:predicted RNA binding protein YcfA (HicA-like mRNA interferase family)
MDSKELRKFISALEAQGFEVKRTRKGHWQVSRNGVWVTTLPGNPTEYRALRNAIAAAKRAGFRWPP